MTLQRTIQPDSIDNSFQNLLVKLKAMNVLYFTEHLEASFPDCRSIDQAPCVKKSIKDGGRS